MNRPVAILGMSAILPGAECLEEYWNLLIEGRCAINEVPNSILDRALYYDERKGVRSKSYLCLGGLIHYPPFNYAKARFPHHLSYAVDTGSLMMVQAAADAMRHAGIDPFDNPYRNTGIYIGNNVTGLLEGRLCYAAIAGEAAQYLNDLESYCHAADNHRQDIIDTVLANIRSNFPLRRADGPSAPCYGVANAISNSLNCHGPSFVLDAACSSSLKAIAMAVQDIHLGKIDTAIAGGCTFFSADTLVIFSAAQSGSLKGSFPFSDNADGLVSAEGYAAVVLKDLERALKDGDTIQAVITGIGVSSDGRGTSFWAPRKEGQVLAVRRAYRNEEDMSRLDYIEAHATSTALGDSVEMDALQEAFQDRWDKKVPIGGVKANIGHTLEAAGVAGLIKSVLVLQKKIVPAQINYEPLNHRIDWERFPFYIPPRNQLLQNRSDGKPLRAAVNSFGIGGLNVHITVEEWSSSFISEKHNVPIAKYANEPIAVIGMGAVLPGANTAKAFAEMVFSGIDPSSEKNGNRGGFLTDWQYDWKKHKIPPKSLATANPLQFMILDSVDAAVVDAGYEKLPSTAAKITASAKYLPTEGTAVVVGSTFGTNFDAQLTMGYRLPHFKRELSRVLHQYDITDQAQIEEILHEFEEHFIKKMPAIVDETCSFTPSSLCSRITKTYHLMGGAATIDSGGTVSLAALDQAVSALRVGTCDVMVCVCGSCSAGQQTFDRLKLAGHFSGNGIRNTFDENSEGTIPAEGAGTLILKRLCDAKRDGDDVKFIIHGIGAGFDADPETALSQAVKKCWQETARTSDCTKEDVAFVECSTSQKEVAVAELDVLRKFYGTDKRTQPLLVDKAESQFGNALGASGLISLFKAQAELQRGAMPKSFGLEKPDKKLFGKQADGGLSAAPHPNVAAASSLEELNTDERHSRLFAAVSSWDPLGSAYHAVIERGVPLEAVQTVKTKTQQPQAAEPPSVQYRTIRLEAETQSALLSQMDEMVSSAEEVFATAKAEQKLTKKYRLAVVVKDAGELRQKLQYALKFGFGNHSGALPAKGIFIGTPFDKPKIAFLFSGQGSQYAGMLKSLVENFAPARKILDEINADLKALGETPFEFLAWENTGELGTDVYKTQLSLLCAGTLLYRILEHIGVSPSVVAGHSYGEYPALVAARVWTFREAVRATKIRCDMIVHCNDADGAMLSTNWDEAKSLSMCEHLGNGDIYVANINSPSQTVLGGGRTAISAAESYIKERGGLAKVLPVPRPFHTELMEGVRQPLYESLGKVKTEKPLIPLLSSVTNDFISTPEEIRQNLADQMTRPVRFIDLVKKLKKEGVNVFVECGPNQILTQFKKEILDDHSFMVLPSDDKLNRGLLPLLCIRACCDVFGISDEPEAADLPKWRTWGAHHRERILQKARQLADHGGMNNDVAGSCMDNEMTAEIAKGAGLFHETVQALAAASGGMENFRKEIENDHREPPTVLPPNNTESTQTFSTITESEFAQLTETMPPEFKEKDFCRFIMRLMKKPLPSSAEHRNVQWNGRALILGSNKLAETLAEKIRQSGTDVVILAADGTREEIEAEIERHWKDGALLHLFLTTAYDSEAGGDWNRRRNNGVLLPFFVTKKWYSLVLQNGLLDKASAVAAVNLGGGFGCNGTMRNPEGGATAGMIKSLTIEAGLQCEFKFVGKVVDFSGEQTHETKAETLLTELAANELYAIETGYVGTERFVVRPVPEPAHAAGIADPTPSGHWLITGGGRGITAYVAHQFALKFGLTLHILGSSPVPVIDERWCKANEAEREKIKQEIRAKCKADGSSFAQEWKRHKRNAELSETIYAMQKDGITVYYYQCDVSRRDEVADTLNKVRHRGKISGILHGAGVEFACAMQDKKPAAVEQTFDVKCGGAAHLMELTGNDSVKHFIAFGSMAGTLGSPGQTDYASANCMLGKICHAYQNQHPHCTVLCGEWGPWKHIGMADHPQRKTNPIIVSMNNVVPQEGFEHLLNELSAPNRQPVALFMGWEQLDIYFPRQTALPVEEPHRRESTAPADELPVSPAKTGIQTSGSDSAFLDSGLRRNDDFESVPTKSNPAPVYTPIRRHLIRWIPQSEPAVHPLNWNTSVLIVGSNSDAVHLAETLEKCGAHVVVLPSEALEDAHTLVARLDEIGKKSALFTHMLLLTSRDKNAFHFERQETDEKRKNILVNHMTLIQYWLKKLADAQCLEKGCIAAVTAMNGDGGTLTGTSALESGYIGGLIKSVNMEEGGKNRSGVTVRIVDFPLDEPSDRLVENLLHELTTDTWEIEVGYVKGKRQVPRLVIEDSPKTTPHKPIRCGDVWLITGGAKGITERLAAGLGKHFGVKLRLLGSSRLTDVEPALVHLTEEELKAKYKRDIIKRAIAEKKSPEKEWNRFRTAVTAVQNIERMRHAGIDVEYYCCDLTDAAQIRTVIADIERKDGSISGLVHGAAIEGNPSNIRFVSSGTLANAKRINVVKVDAVLEILCCISPQTLSYCVAFSSISARMGAAGSASYAASNEMLCKIMGSLRKTSPHVRAVGIHWHAWGEVGMMLRPASYSSIHQLKMQLLPPQDGVQFVIRELEAGLPENEIVVTDSQYYTTFYSEKMLLDSPAPCSADATAPLPLIAKMEGNAAYCTFDPKSDLFLRDHRLKQRPLLPAVISIEAFLETVRQLFPNQHIAALHQLDFKAGLAFETDEPFTVKVLTESAGDRIYCRLTAPFYNSKGKLVIPEKTYSAGYAEFAVEPLPLRENFPANSEAQWHSIRYTDWDSLMYHGPVLQQVIDFSFQDCDCWGRAAAKPLSEFAGERSGIGWQTHPGTVDACLYVCGVAVWVVTNGGIGLPKSMQTFRFGRLPQRDEKLHIWVRKTRSDKNGMYFDVVCNGENGDTLYTMKDYCAQVIPNGSVFRNELEKQ